MMFQHGSGLFRPFFSPFSDRVVEQYMFPLHTNRASYVAQANFRDRGEPCFAGFPSIQFSVFFWLVLYFLSLTHQWVFASQRDIIFFPSDSSFFQVYPPKNCFFLAPNVEGPLPSWKRTPLETNRRTLRHVLEWVLLDRSTSPHLEPHLITGTTFAHPRLAREFSYILRTIAGADSFTVAISNLILHAFP